MASLFNELRSARDERGVAPDASDGVLLAVARARTTDPAELGELLRDKGLRLADSSVVALAAVIRSLTDGGQQAAPAPPAGGGSPPRGGGDTVSFPRLDDQPGEGDEPAGRLVTGGIVTPIGAGAARRRTSRRGPSPARKTPSAAAGGADAAPEAPGDGGAGPPPADHPGHPGHPVPEPSGEPVDDLIEDTGENAAENPGGDLPGEPAGEWPDASSWSDDVDVFASRENPVVFSRDAGEVVELSWPAEEVPGQSVAYVVVASPVGVPTRPGAGTRIAVTTEPHVRVPAGAGPWFSVFGYRADHRSALPSASPVHLAAGRIVPEVTTLHVSTHADAVVLSWTAPPGVDRVRVLRGGPDEPLTPGFNAGFEIPANPGFARDTDVLPGRRYAYRVLTQFVDDATGQQTLSTGRAVLAEIPATPVPVTGLTAQVTGESTHARVELRWPTPALGTVVIHQQSAVPEHAATGRVITTGQLAALPIGEPVGEPTLSDGATSLIPNIPFVLAAGPRRAYTPVTVIGDQVAVGPAAVVNLLGSVHELELTERVTWQLLRLAWPVGATFVQVERGAVGGGPDGSPPVRVSREDYDRDGGLRLQLPASGCELYVRGAVLYATEWTIGPVASTTYAGRWVLRYRFEKVGLLGRRRALQIQVDRAWPDIRMALTTHPDRLPLQVYDSPTAPVALSFPGNATPLGQWVTVEELPLAVSGFTRLFVHHPSGETPIVIDPPMRPRPGTPAPPPLLPGELRCVRCMRAQPELPQVFRCVGRCAPRPDPVRSAFLGEPVGSRPLFAVTGPPMHAAGCPTCGTPSGDLVCKHCHALLQPHSTVTDPVSLTVIGARGTGKTTYLLALISWLQKVWGPSTGATAVPVDESTAARLKEMREYLDHGRAVGSTMAATANEQVLAPLLFRLDQRYGRVRTLAIYDVAGEDMENPQAVRAYAPTLERTDAVLFLLDPLQIRSVRNLLDGQVTLPPIAGDPLGVMENVVGEVRRRTGGSGRLPIPALVALSKLDGIQRGVRSPGTELSGLLNGGSALMYDPTSPAGLELDPADRAQTHEETRSLLLRLQTTQFVHLVESTFARTEYFALSALGHAPAGGSAISEAGISSFRVADPLRWLVDSRWPGR